MPLATKRWLSNANGAERTALPPLVLSLTPHVPRPGARSLTVTAELFPSSWLWLTNLGLALVALAVLRHAPWSRLGSSERQHVFYASAVLVALLWQMRAGIMPGLELHLLGMSTLTLMFGWRLAILAGILAASLSIAVAGAAWTTLGMSALLGAAAPVAITQSIITLVDRWLPRHFFVYVFMNAYGGAMAASGGAYLALIGLASVASAEAAARAPDYLSVLPLLMFPEGFINGTLVTMLVVYRPEWVCSFDDALYLNR